MRILFLDFDGVLNSHEYNRWIDENDARFPGSDFRNLLDPKPIALLRELLISMADLYVVISSSWRHGRSVDQLRTLLSELNGLEIRIIDKTPSGDDPEAYERGHEIQDWLSRHSEVLQFAILDDNSDMVHLIDHLVQTGYDKGLQPEHIEKVVKILETT